ncbi:MAG: FtsX-like permease family protein [Clostridia bacterium]
MNVLSNLTLKNLKLNKSRTIVTLVGIILSTALLVALSGLVSSFIYTLAEMAVTDNGQQHVVFFDVPKDELSTIELNKETEHYYLMECLDYFYYGDETEVESAILAFDENALLENENKLTEGRLPENSSEILLSSDSIYSDVNVGDDFTLPNGETYTVVGKIGMTKGVSWSYPVILYMDEVQTSAHIAVTYKNVKDYEEITQSIVGEDIKYGYSYNTSVLRYQAGVMSDSTAKMMYAIAFVLASIIITTSVFCIRNSFAISITEKIRQYGMLASVGATPKQIKKNVLFEGFILGLIGIPFGILSGVLAAVVLMKITNTLLSASVSFESLMQLHISPIYIIGATLLAVLTIYLSSVSSAIRASKISEIDAIRSTNDIKIKAKSLKTPKYITKFFGIGGTFAYKNIKRNKRKFRTTTISLVVSIATFISLSYFLDLGFQAADTQYATYNYNLAVYGDNSDVIYENLDEFEGINDKNYYLSYRMWFSLGDENDGYQLLSHYCINDEYYYQYLEDEGIEYDEDTVILLDSSYIYNEDTEKWALGNLVESDSEVTVYDLSSPDDYYTEVTLNFIRTETYPLGFVENTYTGILMSSSQFEKYATDTDRISEDYYVNIDCEDPYELETLISEYANENDLSISLVNIEDMIAGMDDILLLISIFLYGFITVIILVGLTNIFNSLSTNMNLRRKEFATLMSVGMTKKEFNKMINFECISYVLKSLLLGVPIGILGALALYQASSYGNTEYVFNLPIKQIIIAAVVVFLVVYGIMKTSLSKIAKQNIIETIRNENI